MAIGIPSGGLDARAAPFGVARAPSPRDAATLSGRNREQAATGIGPTDAVDKGAAVARSRQADSIRVTRIVAGGEAGRSRPGIAAYLGVQRATPAEPHGGELVGIDFYV